MKRQENSSFIYLGYGYNNINVSFPIRMHEDCLVRMLRHTFAKYICFRNNSVVFKEEIFHRGTLTLRRKVDKLMAFDYQS